MPRLTESAVERILKQDGYNVQSTTGEPSRPPERVKGQSSATGRRRNKYNAKKCELDGHKFDSIAERDRYIVLKAAQDNGSISDLRLQPRYRLQNAFTDDYGKRHRAIDYVADFEYVRDGQVIAEDVKGGRATQTQVFSVKFKLAIKRYLHIEFRKVER